MLKALPCMNVLADLDPATTPVVVSGLPRSGTSMMVRMLAFGGIEPLTDGLRVPDDFNSSGYYEYEPVKQPESYLGWIEAAAGRSVKVVSRLLVNLPSTMTYSIVFLQRDLATVIRSQRKMALSLSDHAEEPAVSEALEDIYRVHLSEAIAWIDARPNIRLICVRYEDLIADPKAGVARIAQFLSPWNLDTDKMRQAIDPSLNHADYLAGNRP